MLLARPHHAHDGLGLVPLASWNEYEAVIMNSGDRAYLQHWTDYFQQFNIYRFLMPSLRVKRELHSSEDVSFRL